MSGATPATEALTRAGVSYTLHPYDHDPGSTAYGEEAATTLGVDPLRIFKTLVVDLGQARPEKRYAGVLGAKKASLAR